MYADTNYGASQSYVTIIPVGWNGEAFIDLSDESIASTNVLLDEVKIENMLGDEHAEIIIRGGTYGSLAAGPNRTSTFTYSMSDNGYILVSQEPVLPQDYYFFLVEANQEFVAGNLEEAVSIYENSYQTDDALYYYPTDHQQAFAEFQLMLAYLLLEDEASASKWANTNNFPEQLYSEAKKIFSGYLSRKQ